MAGKIIIVSAPSGTGKSTIISRIIDDPELRLGFSVSATSRAPRAGEQDGVHYYFMDDEEFSRRIDAGEFIEYEEVYAGTHYGTLASEVERVTASGRNLILDIDVKGALNVKRRYGSRALALFIMPPDVATLERRLRGRATDSDEKIAQRLAKAEEEMAYAPRFDAVIVNDDLESAVAGTRAAIAAFVNGQGDA